MVTYGGNHDKGRLRGDLEKMVLLSAACIAPKIHLFDPFLWLKDLWGSEVECPCVICAVFGS